MSFLDRFKNSGAGDAVADRPDTAKKEMPRGKKLTAGDNDFVASLESQPINRQKGPDVFWKHKSGKMIHQQELLDAHELKQKAFKQTTLDLNEARAAIEALKQPSKKSTEKPGDAVAAAVDSKNVELDMLKKIARLRKRIFKAPEPIRSVEPNFQALEETSGKIETSQAEPAAEIISVEPAEPIREEEKPAAITAESDKYVSLGADGNPDGFSAEQLKKMRHLDPQSVAVGPTDFEYKNVEIKSEKQIRQERLAAEKAAEEKEVTDKYEKKFGIKAEELQRVDGFKNLSRGQQLFVLENLSQITLGDIKNESQEEYAAGVKSLPGKDAKFLAKAGTMFENMRYGLNKTLYVAKSDKMKAKEVSHGGMDRYGLLLGQLVDGMQNAPDVAEKNGRLEMQFLQIPGGSEVAGVAQKFNDAANEFMRLPIEWSYEEAKHGQKKLFEATKLRYEAARTEALNAMKERFGEADACVNLNNAEGKIYLNQFWNQNKDAEKEITRLSNQNVHLQSLWDFGEGKRLSFVAGAAIRSLATFSIGMIAAPIAGAGIGAWRARIKGKEELANKDRATRRGKADKSVNGAAQARGEAGRLVYDTSAEAKNFIAAEDLTKKLDDIILQMDQAEGDANETARLAARIKYTKDKIFKGHVIYGRDEDQLTNQYSLVERLSRAQALWEVRRTEDPAPKPREKGDLNDRLDRLMEFKRQNIGAKREKYLRDKMKRCAVICAGCASAGYILHHLADLAFNWQERPLVAEGLQKIFKGTEAAPLPPLATPGEIAVRNLMLNRVEDPFAAHEQLPLGEPSGQEFEPVGFQNGHSVWDEAARQLKARLGAEAKEADINRLKNAIAARPGTFGLPENFDVEKGVITTAELEKIHWNEAVQEVFHNREGLVPAEHHHIGKILEAPGKLMRFDGSQEPLNDMEHASQFFDRISMKNQLASWSEKARAAFDPRTSPESKIKLNAELDKIRSSIKEFTGGTIGFAPNGDINLTLNGEVENIFQSHQDSVIDLGTGGLAPESLAGAHEDILAGVGVALKMPGSPHGDIMAAARDGADPSFHRPSLGYHNSNGGGLGKDAAETTVAEDTDTSGELLRIHKAVLENPNAGPDYDVIQPSEIKGNLVDVDLARHLAARGGNLDLHNVKSISFKALEALQGKTGGTVHLNGLDPNKITDDISQGLSELRKNVKLVVLRDEVAQKVDNWDDSLAEKQPDWHVTPDEHQFSGENWLVDDNHVPAAGDKKI